MEVIIQWLDPTYLIRLQAAASGYLICGLSLFPTFFFPE